MDDLYATPTRQNGRVRDQDEVTVFQTPQKGLVDSNRHGWKYPTTPADGLPTSNRDNVVDALKNIQDRIRALELERTTAEESLRDLSKETDHYRRSLERLRAESPKSRKSQGKDSTSHAPSSPGRSVASSQPSDKHQQAGMQDQLRSADARCELLDKQLDYMRRMLSEAEAEKRLAYERSEQMTRLRNANTAQEMRTQMDKITDMEREHHRLQANQAVAQERIRELERALEETKSEHRSPVPNNLSAELRSAALTNKILIEKLSPPNTPKKTHQHRSRDKRKKSSKKTPCQQPQPGQHYRLNMADIPFVVGQSTAPSHRVGTNVQNVIAMMKNHNKELCAAVGHKARPRSAPGSRKQKKRDMAVVSSTAGESSESENEFQEMMDQLTEEYTHMSAEHHELTRQMDAATHRQIASDLQYEIEKLEVRMATKAEQIAKLSAHQNKLRERRSHRSGSTSAASSASRSVRAKNAYHVPSSSTTGEVQVTTTIKTRGQRADKVVELQPKGYQSNLKTLNRMRMLKTRLKPDDLRWTT